MHFREAVSYRDMTKILSYYFEFSYDQKQKNYNNGMLSPTNFEQRYLWKNLSAQLIIDEPNIKIKSKA